MHNGSFYHVLNVGLHFLSCHMLLFLIYKVISKVKQP